MTPNDFFAQIAQFTSTGIITLSPGPFEIKIDKTDIYAAQLIEGLYEDFADKPTGELNNYLLVGILRRLYDLSDDGTIQVNDVGLWEDEQIQTLLMAWWWMLFFTAQSVEKNDETIDKEKTNEWPKRP